MADATKPVKLQVNNSGAWKNVIRFDAADEVACAEAMDAAEKLGSIGDVTWRVCIDDAMDVVLMRWSSATGWKDAK
jgi:hypothetical protein